jgi:MFS family permease
MVSQGPATIVLGLGTLISHGFGLALVPAMLPRIADDLSIGYGTLGGAVATGLITYAIAAVSTGTILERLEPQVALLGSYALAAGGLLLAGAADSVLMLTLAVMILGFAAPVSWSASLHVAGETTERRARAAVMASASGGAALGVLINGILVQTSDSIHSWRISFVIAASLAALPIAIGLRVYRHRIARPVAAATSRGAYRAAFAARAGRVVVYAGLTAGIAGFPFNVFLTATAIDEMGVSALGAGSIWWLIGVLGLGAGPILGRYGDRTSPLRSLLLGTAMYVAGLVVLIGAWNYTGLLIAAVGYAFMNYPIWGLVGAIASEHFESGLAVRSISLGLVLAALGGAVGNSVAGPWIEATGSFRGPVVALTLMAAILVAWYVAVLRDGGLAPR